MLFPQAARYHRTSNSRPHSIIVVCTPTNPVSVPKPARKRERVDYLLPAVRVDSSHVDLDCSKQASSLEASSSFSPGDVCENEAQIVELSSCCARVLIHASHGSRSLVRRSFCRLPPVPVSVVLLFRRDGCSLTISQFHPNHPAIILVCPGTPH